MTVYWNTRNGLSEYILSAETERLAPLAATLVKIHVAERAGWPEIAGNRKEFDKLIRGFLFPYDPQSGVSLQNNIGRARDLLNVRSRLALLDASGLLIVGPDIGESRHGRHAIVTRDRNGNETILGYLAMVMPQFNERASDLVFERDQIRMAWMTVVLAVLLSSMAAILLSKLFVVPIRDLLSGAKKLSDGSLETRLMVDRYDEMGELQSQFNNLARSLEENEVAERRWLSDTSHELQTPLAILRAEIEALQDGVRQSDEKTLATLHDSVIRLSSLVRDISALSSAREGVVAGILSDEDFSGLISDSANRAESLIAEAGLTLKLDIEPDLVVSCDRLRIGQLLDNLLSNSVRYTQRGGKIHLKVFRQRKRVFIHCEDTAPCPPDESIPKLFDRFYRGEKSRSRLSGGSGLGLPICKAIVLAHRGQIFVERSALGGLKVGVILPMQNFGREN